MKKPRKIKKPLVIVDEANDIETSPMGFIEGQLGLSLYP